MLPRKVIVAVIIASLLFLGYEGLSGSKMKKPPNLLLGFAVVGAAHAVQSAKELAHPI